MECSRPMLDELQQLFYQWCEKLSLDEIVSNRMLRRSIERLERMLLAARGE